MLAVSLAWMLAFANSPVYGASRRDASPVREASLTSLLPVEGDGSGWKRSTDPETYSPENLWKYMDGQAQMYLDYGFRRMMTVELAVSDGAGSMTVEIYEMESPNHAFGIYAAERSSEDEPVRLKDLRVQGSLGEYGLNFWKGDYYVRLASFQDSPNKRNMLIKGGTVISEKIGGSTSLPELFSCFPRPNRIPRSERFIPKNFLGQTYLRNGYRVDYQKGKSRFYMFLADAGSLDQAKKAFGAYRNFLRSQNEAVSPIRRQGVYRFFSTRRNRVIFLYGPVLGGVVDCQTLREAGAMAEEMVRKLSHR